MHFDSIRRVQLANQFSKRLMQLLLGSCVLSASVFTVACNSVSPVTGKTMTDQEQAAYEAEIERVNTLKVNCRKEDGKSCNVMATDVLADYEKSHNFDDLKSAILLATKACYTDKRYCLTKGDLFYRAYKDGHSIDSFLPGRYIREEMSEAYKMATDSGDLAIAADAYYKLGLVNTDFGRVKEAKQNFDMSCKLGNSSYCLKGATKLASSTSKDSDDGKALIESTNDTFKKACDLNNVDACISLASRLDEQKKPAEAEAALQKACSLKDKSACEKLAVRYTKQGKKAEARDAYKQSCDLGNVNSCYVLSRAEIRLGEIDKAAPLVQKTCDSGDANACYISGSLYQVKANSQQTLASLTKACAANNADACYALAISESSDRSGMMSKACSLGNKNACDALASTFVQSNADAVGAYSRSCDAGNKDACVQSGLSLAATGDINGANSMLSKACDLKSAVACEMLAVSSMRSGHYDAAVKSDTRACSLNSANACNRLGLFYTDGIGVKKNLNTALTYFNKACKLGNKGACYIVNGKQI